MAVATRWGRRWQHQGGRGEGSGEEMNGNGCGIGEEAAAGRLLPGNPRALRFGADQSNEVVFQGLVRLDVEADRAD